MSRGRPLAALALIGCLATACSKGDATAVDALGLPVHRPVTKAELRAHGDLLVLAPGSRVVRRVGMDESKPPGADEPDPAFAGTIAVAPMRADALHAWYDSWLVALGYQRAPYYRASDQVAGWAWTAPHGNEQVQVAVYRPGNGAGVRYEELLVDYRVTGAPPAP
ncbi:MAG: hypothetical protein ACJ74O_01505 [Frankiaceae bacterium]